MRKIVTAMVRVAICLVLLTGLLPAMGDCATPSPALTKSKLDQLYEAAKAEGKVVWWDPTKDQAVALLVEEFNKVYPGINVEHFSLPPRQIGPRLLAETGAGRLSVDIVAVTGQQAFDFSKKSLLAPADVFVDVFKAKPSDIIYNNTTLILYHTERVLCYNTKRVAGAEIPRTFEDLLNPKWKGQLVVGPDGGIDCLSFYYPMDYLKAYLAKFLAQQPTVAGSTTAVVQPVITGECKIGLTSGLVAREQQARGAPIGADYLDIVECAPNGMALVKGAPHPNAAALWMAFLSTPEMRAFFEKTTYMSDMRPDSGTKAAAMLAKAAKERGLKVHYMDTEKMYATKEPFEKLVAEAMFGLQPKSK
jgi:iron(III) transport system substrate-binding protein